jgi:xanthine dehydrogenase YagS FAD-binding subunit
MSLWQISVDEPKPFELLQPRSIDEALEFGARYGSDGAFLAGGCDLLDQLKHQAMAPHYVINLKSIAELRHASIDKENVDLGALITLGEIERNPELAQLLPGLLKAASRVATPQIRNLGTLGGNLLQDSRCGYYRGPWYCYRAGGITCDAHHGINAEHAIFGGDRCYTVSPSDLAPILVALDATLKISGDSKQMPVAALFVGPEENILTMHRLKPGELLLGVTIRRHANQRSTFIKYAMRQSWDFALASVAVVFTAEAGRCRDCRIVLGGIAPTPWRSVTAEQEIEGKLLAATNIEGAARAAIAGANPLKHNEYKLGLVKKLVRTALTELSA